MAELMHTEMPEHSLVVLIGPSGPGESRFVCRAGEDGYSGLIEPLAQLLILQGQLVNDADEGRDVGGEPVKRWSVDRTRPARRPAIVPTNLSGKVAARQCPLYTDTARRAAWRRARSPALGLDVSSPQACRLRVPPCTWLST